MADVDASMPFRYGEILLGKYRVEAILGAGGMGVVVRATHLQLDQPVALKFLKLQAPSAAEALVASERFLREARATFRLRSEHAVRLLDLGTLPDGTPFIVMELLVGRDLREVLNARRMLPVSEAVDYALQICLALEEAHAHGIVHRDLKPRNLFLASRVDGTSIIKVLDFGISKVTTETDVNPLTDPHMALGSPRYMAPEQWLSSATVDARADLFAVGMVLYEMLTGRVALAGLALGELIRRFAAGAIPSPRELRPELPESLSRVVLRALRPHPDERYPTSRHLAQALREASPPQLDARPRPQNSLGQSADSAPLSADAATTVPLRANGVSSPPTVPAAGLVSTVERAAAGDDFDEAVALTTVDEAGRSAAAPGRAAGATMFSATVPESDVQLRSTMRMTPLALPAGSALASLASPVSAADLPASMQAMSGAGFAVQGAPVAATRAYSQPASQVASYSPPASQMAAYSQPASQVAPQSPPSQQVASYSPPASQVAPQSPPSQEVAEADPHSAGVPVWVVAALALLALGAAVAAAVLSLRH